MENNNREFKTPFYEISTDYKKLWELIHEGCRVPAWLVNKHSNNENIIWSIVEVAYHEEYKEYSIYAGGRVYGFTKENTYEDFLQACKAYDLHYALPTKTKKKLRSIDMVLVSDKKYADSREIIFSINSNYRAVCKYNFDLMLPLKWFCFIQKRISIRKYLLFGKHVDVWITEHSFWYATAIISIKQLKDNVIKSYLENILNEKENGVNIK